MTTEVVPAFDPTAFLQALGLGKYAAAVMVLLSFALFILSHVMPYVPQPEATSPVVWQVLWKVLSKATGGYGNTTPASTVNDPASSGQVPTVATPAVPQPIMPSVPAPGSRPLPVDPTSHHGPKVGASLVLALVLSLSLPLAACAPGASPQITVQTISNDVSLIATGLTAAVPNIQGIDAATEAKIVAVLGQLAKAAGQVSSAASVPATVPNVQNLLGYVAQIASLAQPFAPPGSPFAIALSAAQVLIPVIEAEVGIVAPAGAASLAMTPNTARLVLRGNVE